MVVPRCVGRVGRVGPVVALVLVVVLVVVPFSCWEVALAKVFDLSTCHARSRTRGFHTRPCRGIVTRTVRLVLPNGPNPTHHLRRNSNPQNAIQNHRIPLTQRHAKPMLRFGRNPVSPNLDRRSPKI